MDLTNKLSKIKYDFVKNGKYYIFVSLAILFVGLICLFVHGFNLGIDFTGGTVVNIKAGDKLNTTAVYNEYLNRAQNVLDEYGVKVAYNQKEGTDESTTLQIRYQDIEGKDVDVIIAPIADNSMYSIISDFIEGGITDEQCINALSANRLGRQFVILNDRILNNNVKIIKESFLCEEEKHQYEGEIRTKKRFRARSSWMVEIPRVVVEAVEDSEYNCQDGITDRNEETYWC